MIGENKKINTLTIITVVLIVLAAVVFGLVAIPLLKKLKTNSAKAAMANYNTTAGKKYISDIEAAYSKLAANPDAVALLDTASPVNPDVAGAMTQLDGLVSDSGLALNTMSPSQGDNGSMKINLLTNGTYENLQKFLVGLENNLRPFVIDSITINSYESGDQTLTAGDFSIELSFAGGQAKSNQSTESQTATAKSGGSNE